jgi:hypothetical protein
MPTLSMPLCGLGQLSKRLAIRFKDQPVEEKMFNLTENMLKSILSLHNSQERGAWVAFIQEMKRLRDDNLSEVLHFVPPRGDMNTRERQDVMRGITICLDVLSHAFEDPVSALEEVRIIGKPEPDSETQLAF